MCWKTPVSAGLNGHLGAVLLIHPILASPSPAFPSCFGCCPRYALTFCPISSLPHCWLFFGFRHGCNAAKSSLLHILVLTFPVHPEPAMFGRRVTPTSPMVYPERRRPRQTRRPPISPRHLARIRRPLQDRGCPPAARGCAPAPS